MAQNGTTTTEELPAISSVATTARVGESRSPAVVIWFGPGDRSLRYRWSEDRSEIREEIYKDGVVHEALGVGGSREELAEYALESLAEYINSYQADPTACQRDWPHVYELLVADE